MIRLQMKATVFHVSFTFPPMSPGSILHRSYIKFYQAGLEMEKSQKGGKSEPKRRKYFEPSQYAAWFTGFNQNLPPKNKTRGQRPNESQKAVVIDMMKSVGEIASKI